MSETRARSCLIAVVLWCVILAVLGVAYRFLVHPHLKQKLEGATSATSQYQDELAVAVDSFSGYAVLRSDLLRRELKARQVKYTVAEDGGDINARLKALQQGKVQLAAFSIDSLLLAGSRLRDYPGTIVLVLDESKGGDAIVAGAGVGSLQDLNRAEARIVLTPDSPSEFFARIVLAHFNLPNLPAKWWVEANGPKGVYQQLRAGGAGAPQAYVLWEPFVSLALAEKGVHVLLDSSRLRGYIVDVLVVQRTFLQQHPDKVRQFVEAYFRAAYAYAQGADGWVKLVQEDAREGGAGVASEAQARQIVQGIWWKNTLENYAHFGLAAPAGQVGLEHLEDVIAKIVDVLVKTKALASDPLERKYHTLFYPQILAELQREKFHPGRAAGVIPGLGPDGPADEQIRRDQESGELTPGQWGQLQPVGELRVEPIVFSRGSATLSLESERDLRALARRLESFPRFYLRILGQTRAEGDPEANRLLAQGRAEAVRAHLQAQGLKAERMRVEAAPASSAGGEGQSVVFVVGQFPY